MRIVLKTLLAVIGLLAFLAVILMFWMSGLAKDDSGGGRPASGAYTWSSPPPRGGPVPRADGYVVGSLGTGNILTPMPPERTTDIVHKDNVHKAVAIKTCFWPGPRLRSGYYTCAAPRCSSPRTTGRCGAPRASTTSSPSSAMS